MNISIIVPTCGPGLEDTFSPKGASNFFYPNDDDDDDNSFVSTESAYGKYAHNNEGSGHQNVPSREHNHIASGLGSFANQLPSGNIYETLVIGKQTSDTPMHVGAAMNRSLIPNTLPIEEEEEEDDNSFVSTESAYGKYTDNNEGSGHRNVQSREHHHIAMDQTYMTSGLGYFANQLPSSNIYETLVVGKQPSNAPIHVRVAMNRSLIPNTLPIEEEDDDDDDDNSFVSTESAFGKYTDNNEGSGHRNGKYTDNNNEGSGHRNVPSREHNHIAMDQRNMASGLGYFANQLSSGNIYETLVIGKQTSDTPMYVGAAMNRSLIPNTLPIEEEEEEEDDNSFVSTESAYGKYTDNNEGSSHRNAPSREHHHITMDQRNMTSGLGYYADKLPSSDIYETLVVGKQTSTNPKQVGATKNRSLTPNTLPMEQSDSEWSSGSSSSDSTFTREQSRGHRDGDFDWDEASYRYGKRNAIVSNLNRKGAPTKKGASKQIACGVESMEHDLFSALGSLLGLQMRQHVERGDGIDVDNENDEDEIPTSRLYADLRKQRLRNQFLSFERDTLNQQLEERVQEIQKMKLKMHEQIRQTKKFDEEKVEASEKIAEMLNDLLEATVDFSELGSS